MRPGFTESAETVWGSEGTDGTLLEPPPPPPRKLPIFAPQAKFCFPSCARVGVGVWATLRLGSLDPGSSCNPVGGGVTSTLKTIDGGAPVP